ncbi:addiction module HigA family antidote [Flavobacterium arsenatis]|uniref:Addiction module HigA family antidote n=1 Tax=Flavobacterium arsenatis TaxID=1484332 RepID=A0ABU1TJR9_9FLAO|nr:helix-turn-helix domain-containing protein [Flavobacterium arsenatis]MDR6966223.1 addiction module HigA family antidote [Flavobacterium arsenatis]
MKTKLEILKGVHPGKFIERELLKLKISKRQFALSINEHPQTLGAIIKGTRNMNVDLSLKIEEKLGLEEGFLMTLQVFHDIKLAKRDVNYKPDLSKLNKITFWDTTFEKIDWKLMKRSIIQRIFSYGNKMEQEEIIRFYGKNEVDEILSKIQLR